MVNGSLLLSMLPAKKDMALVDNDAMAAVASISSRDIVITAAIANPIPVNIVAIPAAASNTPAHCNIVVALLELQYTHG